MQTMNRINLWMLLFILALTGCENERKDHYKVPDWLQGPLFEQIESTGKYNEFVKAAKLTGYDEFLSSRLTFTVFVPTDEAFQEYYSEQGVNSAEELDKDELLALLQYHTCQNSWDSVKMAGKTSFGWWNNLPDNFRTPCIYTPAVSTDDGKNVVYDNTFLLLFSNPFFDKNGYTSIDYESFYPGSVWTGYNIDRASVLENEQGAENGFYYVIDRVMIPKTTADKMIAANPDFSVFSQMLDLFVRYDYDAKSTGNSTLYDSLFKRSYALNFNLSNEKIPDNAYDGYYHVFNTVFVPGNQEIQDYFDDNFPAYPDIESVPYIIKKYFVEAHMLPNKKLFPTVLARTENERNDFSDEILFDLDNGINSLNLCSNAIIYGVDQVINTNAFSTVSGPIIKNPDFRIFTMLLELSGEIRSFFKSEIKHAVFVLPDQQMTDLGFNYAEGDPADFTDDKIYRDNSELNTTQMKDFLQSFISITSKDVNGTDEAYIKTKNNQYLKISSGTVEGLFGQSAVANSFPAVNGTVLEIDADLSQVEDYTIEDYLNDNKDSFGEFFTLCDSAGMLDADGNIVKLSVFTGVTLLLPTDAAIQAIKGSYIPSNATSETFPFRSLVQYQIISERVMFTDDEFPESGYGTDLFINAQRYKITASAQDGIISITDLKNNSFQITTGTNSNIITSNGIIHIVDQVALY